MRKTKIAIMASGRGSNAKALIVQSQAEDAAFEISLIVSNRKKAGVLQLASDHDIPTLTLSRKEFYESESFVEELKTQEIDMIVLAGFLWLIPPYLVHAYHKKIINIHPALLPLYGGKGMYGHHVHEAVKEANDDESGMTVHFVNEAYDEGSIIFQSQCQIAPSDTAEDIASRVLKLEHHFYPKVINGLARRMQIGK